MITWSEKQAAEYERADQMSPHHPSHHRAYHPRHSGSSRNKAYHPAQFASYAT